MSEAKNATTAGSQAKELPAASAAPSSTAAAAASAASSTAAAAATTAAESQQQVRAEGGKSKATAQADIASKPPIVQEEQEPLCLEYATPTAIPLHVRQLLEQHQSKMPAAETLLLLIYVVALECGFAEEQRYQQRRCQLKPVPTFASFHAGNVRLLTQQPAVYTQAFNDTAYCLQLRTLVGQPAAEAPVAPLQSRLMAVVLGDLLMVTLSPSPPSKEPGYSVCLSIGRYVLNVQQRNKPLFHSFRKLDELSFQLREQLFQPMRAQQLIALKYQLQPTLTGLPGELYEEIFRHLNKQQLNIVGRANGRLKFFSDMAKPKRG